MYMTMPRAVPFQRIRNGPWFVEARSSVMGVGTRPTLYYCAFEWPDRAFPSRDEALASVRDWWRGVQQ